MQTSDKIQIAVLCVQVAVGVVQVVTTYFFIRSVRIAARQEEDARRQIDLAVRQSELIAKQYEESMRPVVSVRFHSQGSNVYQIELLNEGLGPALHLTCEPQMDLNAFLIGAKGSTTAYIAREPIGSESRQKPFTLTYQSLSGRIHATTFCQSGAGIVALDYRDIYCEEDRELLRQYRQGFIAGSSKSR